MASPLGTLSRLPPELRIQIYSLVLDSPDVNRFGPDIPEAKIDLIYCENTKHMTLSPTLFRTSRVIASETIPLYLRSHKFTIRLDPNPQGLLLGWMQHAVGVDYWHCLRDVFLWSSAAAERAVWAWSRNMRASEQKKAYFWTHREIMMVYRADRAQTLRFDVFNRPLNPRLARLLYQYLHGRRTRKDDVRELEDVQKVLDWLWVDAMRLGRQLMIQRTPDSMIASRFGLWSKKMHKLFTNRELLERTIKESTGCDVVAA